jgi:hypothetical protein
MTNVKVPMTNAAKGMPFAIGHSGIGYCTPQVLPWS